MRVERRVLAPCQTVEATEGIFAKHNALRGGKAYGRRSSPLARPGRHGPKVSRRHGARAAGAAASAELLVRPFAAFRELTGASGAGDLSLGVGRV